jgi:acetyl esterase/lipase
MIRRLVLPFLVLACLATCPPASANDAIFPDVVYGHKDGMALTFDVFKPHGEANGAALLFMVSGGWRSRWAPPERSVGRFQPLLDKGFTVFSVRHGSSPKYTIPEIVGDVRRSVRFVRLYADRWGIDPKRIGVFGGSAGGHLTLMLATGSDEGYPEAEDPVESVSDRVAAAVALYPPTDLRDIVPVPPNRSERWPALNFDPSRAGDFSPLVQVSSDDPPTLLIHGDSDELVPPRHSQSILEAFHKADVNAELILLKGAGHGFRGEDGRRATDAMVNWFEKYLAKPSAN